MDTIKHLVHYSPINGFTVLVFRIERYPNYGIHFFEGHEVVLM